MHCSRSEIEKVKLSEKCHCLLKSDWEVWKVWSTYVWRGRKMFSLNMGGWSTLTHALHKVGLSFSLPRSAVNIHRVGADQLSSVWDMSVSPNPYFSFSKNLINVATEFQGKLSPHAGAHLAALRIFRNKSWPWVEPFLTAVILAAISIEARFD